MDRVDWIILKNLEEGNSISTIAKKLFITQPAISYRLTKMEAEYAATLFHKSNKGVSLTDAGKRLSRYASQMLTVEDEIKQVVASAGDEITGHIDIGCVPSVANYLLPGMMKTFCTRYPKISVDIDIDLTPSLYKRLASGSLSCAIVRGTDFPDWIEGKYDISSEMAVIVSNEPITDDYLLTRPCLNARNYKSSSSTHIEQIINSWFMQNLKAAPINSNIRVLGGSGNILPFVRSGLGWAVMTSSKWMDDGSLYHRVLFDSNGEPYLYKTVLLYRNEFLQRDAFRVFLDYLKSCI